MAHLAPVEVDARVRENYDRTWSLYPYEHPRAYWLRSNGEVILCTRCGSRCALGEDPEVFVERNLACPLGYGLRTSAKKDPLFEGDGTSEHSPS